MALRTAILVFLFCSVRTNLQEVLEGTSVEITLNKRTSQSTQTMILTRNIPPTSIPFSRTVPKRRVSLSTTDRLPLTLRDLPIDIYTNRYLYDVTKFVQENRRLAKAIVEALQDSSFDEELLFDLKKENQVYLNRTMSFLIKYIVKREVDNYRSRRTDAISRRVYSALIMKLIDIAKDLPRNSSAASRIDTAHRYYMSVESSDMHDQMADLQVFHACARLYDVMYTNHNCESKLKWF